MTASSDFLKKIKFIFIGNLNNIQVVVLFFHIYTDSIVQL